MVRFSFSSGKLVLNYTNCELITRFEKKIQASLAKVLGEALDDNSTAKNANPSNGVPFETKMVKSARQAKSLASAL